jgi:hypothetical protein
MAQEIEHLLIKQYHQKKFLNKIKQQIMDWGCKKS